jgi:hypothetical protein
MIKYVEILFRNRLRFLILLLILPAELSVGAALLYPHNTAVSSLWVDTPTYFSVSPAATGWSQYLTPAQNTVDAIDQMVKTDAFYKTLNTQLFDEHTFKNAGERDATMSSLSTDLRIATAGSHLVTLSHTCVRTAICISVLNATVGIYRTWFAGQQRAQANVAIDFYTRQLTDEQAKLAAAQKALTAYAAANPNLKPADAPTIPEFDQLVRNVDQERTSVAALQQKVNNIQFTDLAVAQIDNSVLSVIDPPRATGGGELSSLPKKQIAIVWIACLALAAAALVLMAWIDRNARDPKELERRLKVPVVVTIPDLASVEARG